MQNGQLLDQLLRVTDALATDMSGFLAGHGLNTAKAHVLWTLRGAGPQKQRWLSDELGYSPRHVTTLIDDLIALGFVARAAHPDDRRAVLVTLTGAGRDLMANFETDRLELADQLFGHLDAETKTSFVAILTDVGDRIATLIAAAQPAAPEARR